MSQGSQDKRYAFFKGNFVPMEEAKISIMNHAFMYGTAVFEGLRGYWNEQEEQMYLFRVKEHYERMFDSMKVMFMELKYSIDELTKITAELVSLNKPRTDVYVRVTTYTDVERVGFTLKEIPTNICMFAVP